MKDRSLESDSLVPGISVKHTFSILVVDDAPSVNYFHRHILKECGLHTLGARNGHEALAIIKTERVDAILLDVLMTGMGGLELINQLATLNIAIPILLISSEREIDVLPAARATYRGSIVFLKKPVFAERIISEFQRLSGKKAGS